jgi:sugar/nucleoside kinase (ribokinase family)
MSTPPVSELLLAVGGGYDIAFVGAYTQDTIVSAAGTRVVDGGAFHYGAHVAVRMGLRVAAITRLARRDWHVVEGLKRLGVDVFAEATPASTCLRLEYPTADVDRRVITVTSEAGPFTVEQVAPVEARAFVVGASFRGEVGPDVLQALSAKGALVAADAQGFARVARGGVLAYDSWPEKREWLGSVDILKPDAMEAEVLTGSTNLHEAARILSGMGPAEIVLTHRDGLLVWASGQVYQAGFFPRPLVGRSGRGDTCLAAYAARRLSASPAEATVWAAAATSLKMEAEGPFRGTIQQIEACIRERYA